MNSAFLVKRLIPPLNALGKVEPQRVHCVFPLLPDSFFISFGHSEAAPDVWCIVCARLLQLLQQSS